MSSQSKYGAVEVAEAPAATPRRARGVVLALCLLAGGALFAVAGPGPSQPVWKSTSVSGAPDNSSRSHFHTDQDVDSDLHDAVVKKRREHGRDQPREVVPLAHLVVVVVALIPVNKREGVDEDEEQHAEN